VLFSAPQCRVVVIDLERGERLGEHRVRERAVVEVIAGSVTIEASGRSVACAAGTLVTFEPGERHAVRACTAARLLLVLAPWPAADHYTEAEAAHGDPLPRNALLEPDESFDAPTE
jgi:quercetin dioxygenase-like cupin family protein